jgi:predicted phosphodiesterase
MAEKIAILSDIHGNVPALQAVLEDIHLQGCSRLFVLGDIINGLDPHGCVHLLRTWDGPAPICLQGNAEAYTLTADLDRLPGRELPDNTALIRLIGWFRSHLSADDLAWLQSFPDILYWGQACLVHDSPLDRVPPKRWHQPGIAEKYQEWFYHAPGIREELPREEMDRLVEWMKSQHLSQVFCAHTHVPFLKTVDSLVICNVGSVGFTLDGDPRASYALLEETTGQASQVSIRRVAYNLDRVFRMIDNTPDYPSFEQPGRQAAYRKMIETATHWSVYSPR